MIGLGADPTPTFWVGWSLKLALASCAPVPGPASGCDQVLATGCLPNPAAGGEVYRLRPGHTLGARDSIVAGGEPGPFLSGVDTAICHSCVR